MFHEFPKVNGAIACPATSTICGHEGDVALFGGMWFQEVLDGTTTPAASESDGHCSLLIICHVKVLVDEEVGVGVEGKVKLLLVAVVNVELTGPLLRERNGLS